MSTVLEITVTVCVRPVGPAWVLEIPSRTTNYM